MKDREEKKTHGGAELGVRSDGEYRNIGQGSVTVQRGLPWERTGRGRVEVWLVV